MARHYRSPSCEVVADTWTTFTLVGTLGLLAILRNHLANGYAVNPRAIVKRSASHTAWAEWSSWQCLEPCTISKPLALRTRHCVNEETKKYNTAQGACPTDSDTGLANVDVLPCKRNGKYTCINMWSWWGAWSGCTTTCDQPQTVRTRRCLGYGQACSGEGRQVLDCPGNWPACPPRDGGWGSWQAWSPCSATCGDARVAGRKVSNRFCDNPKPFRGGQQCPGQNMRQESCAPPKPCPEPGEWSNWSAWKCDVTCGNGTGVRHRSCWDPTAARTTFNREKRDIRPAQLGSFWRVFPNQASQHTVGQYETFPKLSPKADSTPTVTEASMKVTEHGSMKWLTNRTHRILSKVTDVHPLWLNHSSAQNQVATLDYFQVDQFRHHKRMIRSATEVDLDCGEGNTTAYWPGCNAFPCPTSENPALPEASVLQALDILIRAMHYNMQRKEGHVVEFICNSDVTAKLQRLYPRASFKWMMNEKPLEIVPSRMVYDRGDLVIRNVLPTDNGVYICRMDWKPGSFLTVGAYALSIVSNHTQVHVSQGRPFKLKCNSVSLKLLYSGVYTMWTHNDTVFKSYQDDSGHGDAESEKVEKARPDDAGLWECVAVDPYSQRMWTTNRIVVAVDPPLTFVQRIIHDPIHRYGAIGVAAVFVLMLMLTCCYSAKSGDQSAESEFNSMKDRVPLLSDDKSPSDDNNDDEDEADDDDKHNNDDDGDNGSYGSSPEKEDVVHAYSSSFNETEPVTESGKAYSFSDE